MIYRQATEDDLHEVSMLWFKMVEEMRPEWTPDMELWAAMGKTLLGNPDLVYTIIVAENDGEMVGFIDGMIFNEPSTGKCHGVGQHFYVLPEHRKTNVASKLYEEIVSVALKNGAEVLEFFCFPEDLDFWGKRGFKLTRCLVRREVDV